MYIQSCIPVCISRVTSIFYMQNITCIYTSNTVRQSPSHFRRPLHPSHNDDAINKGEYSRNETQVVSKIYGLPAPDQEFRQGHVGEGEDAEAYDGHHHHYTGADQPEPAHVVQGDRRRPAHGGDDERQRE